jgi:cell wall-associated NlpC family hydrolase
LLEEVITSYLGTPYKWGGTTPAGFDCSGFVLAVYREVYEITLPRTSAKMWKRGRKIPINAARPGDLVFFKGGSFGTIDHVGIYMGNNRFAHSSTSSGVIYSGLNETYYARRFAGVRRMQ